MSYDLGWGFQSNVNEYGQDIKLIPKEEDVNRSMNEFIVEFNFKLNKDGYNHYRLEIVDDYETESTRKIELYFLHIIPTALTAATDIKFVDIFIPIPIKIDFKIFIASVRKELGLSISYVQIESEPFYCVNFLATSVKLLIESHLHKQNWISLYEAGGNDLMWWGIRYLPIPHVFHAVSVSNVTCAPDKSKLVFDACYSFF
jgi:hypothetical protein